MVIQRLSWSDYPAEECRHGALSIGNFDGVHRGHRALMAELRRQAAQVSGPAVAMTFDPHPWHLLRPGQMSPPLTTTEDRIHLLRSAGADHVLVITTSDDLLQLTAEEFVSEVVKRRMDARVLVEGANFHFGHDRLGDVSRLAELAGQDGRRVVVVAPVLAGLSPVSSSRIRAALLAGRVKEVAECLGRLYTLTGIVGTGQRRGHTLGVPTANLVQTATLIPGDGVYAVRVRVKEQEWPGAANLGPNPTFGENARKVEVHLIGFSGQLYGHPIEVGFVDRIRDTRPFSRVEDLLTQLSRDVEQARKLVGAHSLSEDNK